MGDYLVFSVYYIDVSPHVSLFGRGGMVQVLLLMSTALMTSPPHGLQDLIYDDLRLRQQRIAEITEMIHVSNEFGTTAFPA